MESLLTKPKTRVSYTKSAVRNIYLFTELVGQSISHHSFASTRWSMEQQHHPCTVSDRIIQPQLPTTSLVCLKVADCVINQLLLFFAQYNLYIYIFIYLYMYIRNKPQSFSCMCAFTLISQKRHMLIVSR